ncbi:hypothetical protein [Haloglomus salinum]|uniref:hypothetical protein n=1 Tax=Haloglomus salinum TaxID=2962673 RepID=UPI0020C956B8|nr:hypothetical protein [Haloglomus salinum]
MSSKTKSGKTEQYRIECKLSAGKVKDPVTGEAHEIEGFEDKRGGTIEVARADSAHYIVDTNSRMSFVGEAPTESEVEAAERERCDWATTDLCREFLESRSKRPGEYDMAPERGFDPESDQPRNDKKIRAMQVYEALQANGYEDEAGFLRALPNLSLQDKFAKFVRDHSEVTV